MDKNFILAHRYDIHNIYKSTNGFIGQGLFLQIFLNYEFQGLVGGHN